MSPQTSSTADRIALAATRPSALLQTLLAAALGAVLVFGIGFSHIEALHNAAHDTRHSAAFPCH